MNTIELAKMVENIVREEVYRMRDLEVELFTKENPNNKLKKLLKLKASSR
ncbi:MAG: hypothetical protein HUJ61_05175 [Bacilli bacterium]|nr:hypothetical protein [Bacilli bacterium]